MTNLQTMVAHLMQFVELGDENYARYAAKRYELTNPWELADLPQALEAALRATSPAAKDAPSTMVRAES
jgi:hypothetical protein